MFRIAGLAAVAVSVAGCASVMGDTESTVAIRTDPAGAECQLWGRDGYRAETRSPGPVTIPHKASPVTVTCVAPGFRPTSASLDATADGWIWGNAGLIFGTGGVVLLGAVVDEHRGAGKSYRDEVEVKLDPDRPRAIRVQSRADGSDVRLKAR